MRQDKDIFVVVKLYINPTEDCHFFNIYSYRSTNKEPIARYCKTIKERKSNQGKYVKVYLTTLDKALATRRRYYEFLENKLRKEAEPIINNIVNRMINNSIYSTYIKETERG